jgi:hypothetical protein
MPMPPKPPVPFVTVKPTAPPPMPPRSTPPSSAPPQNKVIYKDYSAIEPAKPPLSPAQRAMPPATFTPPAPPSPPRPPQPPQSPQPPQR